LAGNTSGSNGGGNGGSGSGGKRGSSEKSAAGVTLRQRVSTRACVVPLYRAEMVTSNSLAVRRLVSRSVRSNVHWLERYVTALHAAGWHPNVVFMHALVQLPTELWLVMEWCDNSSVSEAMRRLRAPLVEPQIAAVLKHAVAGLLHLRSHSICHGDLKCANIMLTSAGDAKLTDVTFSATLDAPAYREVVRSAPFVAPEVVVGGAVTYASDVWSLGVCALEMAYGSPPAALVAVGGVAVPTIAWPDIASTHTAGLAALVRACHVHSAEQRATIDALRRMNFLTALDADMARRALAALATRCLRAQIASFSGTRSGDTEASSFTNSNNTKEVH
jgi:serine/threonine protein kinase